jgi:hypothetical protein
MVDMLSAKTGVAMSVDDALSMGKRYFTLNTISILPQDLQTR